MPQRNLTPWLIFSAFAILLDQLSKWLILGVLRPGEIRYVNPVFNWVLAFNPGAAFNFLSDQGGWQRWFFTGLALAISIWIVYLLSQNRNRFCLSLALSLILGGAIGNVIDRIRFGAVVDFIQLHIGQYYWPAFNIADSAICIGAALLVWSQLFGKTEQPLTTTG